MIGAPSVPSGKFEVGRQLVGTNGDLWIVRHVPGEGAKTEWWPLVHGEPLEVFKKSRSAGGSGGSDSERPALKKRRAGGRRAATSAGHGATPHESPLGLTAARALPLERAGGTAPDQVHPGEVPPAAQPAPTLTPASALPTVWEPALAPTRAPTPTPAAPTLTRAPTLMPALAPTPAAAAQEYLPEAHPRTGAKVSTTHVEGVDGAADAPRQGEAATAPEGMHATERAVLSVEELTTLTATLERALAAEPVDVAVAAAMLTTLETAHVSLALLRETGVGRVVVALRRATRCHLSDRASVLVAEWKQVAAAGRAAERASAEAADAAARQRDAPEGVQMTATSTHEGIEQGRAAAQTAAQSGQSGWSGQGGQSGQAPAHEERWVSTQQLLEADKEGRGEVCQPDKAAAKSQMHKGKAPEEELAQAEAMPSATPEVAPAAAGARVVRVESDGVGAKQRPSDAIVEVLSMDASMERGCAWAGQQQRFLVRCHDGGRRWVDRATLRSTHDSTLALCDFLEERLGLHAGR